MQRTPPRWPTRSERGFTLIELTVVIAIIAIMAATLLPVITQPYIQERRAEAIREMTAIEEGIYGRPDLGEYGFLGTIGRFPDPNNLSELVAQGALPAPALDNGVPIGWQGPYLRVATNQPLIDPWGQPYALTANPATVGTPQPTYQLRSNGPDGQFGSADDIYFPLNSTTWWNSSVQTLTISVAQVSGPAAAPVPDNTSVELHYPQGGAGASRVGLVNGGIVTFASTNADRIPFGLLGVRVQLGGNWYTRQIVALRPTSSAQVYVPAPGQTFPTPGGCWIQQSFNAPTVVTCGTMTVLAGQVVDATFTGGWHTNSSGSPCYAAISLVAGDPPATQNFTTAAAAPFAPVATTSTAAWSTISVSRTQQAPGTTLTPALVVQPSGGGTCTIDGGALNVKTWKP